jgi:cell wall-associated NlpC family hydrolase
VYRIHGIEIPRDAALQWKCGRSVGKSPGRLAEGDLVFFSADGVGITHVGIALGYDGLYIHASGFVRINSLMRSHELFDAARALTYAGGRRLGVAE